MKASDLRKALRSVGTRRSTERAAPLLSDEERERFGLTITVAPAEPAAASDDDDSTDEE